MHNLDNLHLIVMALVWVELMNKMCFFHSELKIKFFQPSPYARSLHDTTYAYLRALNLTKAQYGYLSTDLARNGTLINNMSNGEFIGNLKRRRRTLKKNKLLGR